jgi:C-terminal processing protease CtpA/Prc
MIIVESDNFPKRVEVVEVSEGSNAWIAGIRPGDLVRAVTAQKNDALKASESNIAFNVLAGASTAGMDYKPALFRADGFPLERVMGALGTDSEAKGGSGRASLVVERRME